MGVTRSWVLGPNLKIKFFLSKLKIGVQYTDYTNLSCINIGNQDIRTPIINPGYANENNNDRNKNLATIIDKTKTVTKIDSSDKLKFKVIVAV